MKTYEVISPLSHDNKLYPIGKSITLDGEAAAPLIDAGALAPPAPSAFDTIVAAIDGLDETDGYTAGGVPKTSALAAALGTAVSAEDRDAAWALYRKRRGLDDAG